MKNTTLFEMDKKRYPNGSGTLRYLKYFRRAQETDNKILKKMFKIIIWPYTFFHGLEIPVDTEIRGGLYIGHPYNITINSSATLGMNVNIHKGVTIGQENRGTRMGSPKIGNQVWIGVNATIAGRIEIGDDVLIAPNSYVNCNVPSHSIVFGNPCIIKMSENATHSYINNLA